MPVFIFLKSQNLIQELIFKISYHKHLLTINYTVMHKAKIWDGVSKCLIISFQFDRKKCLKIMLLKSNSAFIHERQKKYIFKFQLFLI